MSYGVGSPLPGEFRWVVGMSLVAATGILLAVGGMVFVAARMSGLL